MSVRQRLIAGGYEALPFAALLLLYGAHAARAILGGDNPELVLLYAEGGVAHPPGFPAYVLLLRALSWLPASTPAQGAAWVSALCMAACCVVLARACRSLGASPIASTLAAAAFALSPLTLRLATSAEVFALNALIAALIGWLAVAGDVQGTARAGLLGLAAGIGLSGHHSIVLLAPLGVLGVVRGLREARRRAVAALAAGLGLLVGLSAYLHPFWVARHHPERWRWGDTGTLPGLWHHFVRADYGTTQLSQRVAEGVTWFDHEVALGRHLAAAYLGLGFLLALWGLIEMLRRPERRGVWLAVLASITLSGPLFVARFTLGVTGIEASVVERFYLLPQALFVLPLAAGIDALSARVAALRARQLLLALAVVALAAALPPGLNALADHNRPSIELYARNVLASAPERAVVLGTGDFRALTIEYLQRVEGMRRDVVFLDPWLLLYPWYRSAKERQLGVAIAPPVRNSLDTVTLVERALAAARPVLLTDIFNKRIPERFALIPQGLLFRVARRGEPPPSLAALEARNVELFERYTLDDAPTADCRSWSYEAQRSYAAPFIALAGELARLGDGEGAARNQARASVFLPPCAR